LSLQETQALPRVPGFVEGFLSGPRERKSLPRAALSTAVLTALHPLPRVGPSAGWDPHNQALGKESTVGQGASAVKFWCFFIIFYYISCIFILFFNFFAYFRFELQVLKTMHVYDWKNDIVAS
jgi:hypothetical protein